MGLCLLQELECHHGIYLLDPWVLVSFLILILILCQLSERKHKVLVSPLRRRKLMMSRMILSRSMEAAVGLQCPCPLLVPASTMMLLLLVLELPLHPPSC